MSYCKRDGKDKSLFLTREDAKDPENIKTLVEDEETYGLIAPDGSINWDCPCLGGMANGLCGSEFKEAFGCFHYSKEEMKGSDCLDQFKVMQECFQKYPEVYSKFSEDEEDEEGHNDKEDKEIPEEANNNDNNNNNNDDNNNINNNEDK